MVDYSSESKSLSAVAQYFGTKNTAIKSEVATCLGDIAEKLGTKVKSFKDSDKLITQMSLFLSDANQEVRANTRIGVGKLREKFGDDESLRAFLRIHVADKHWDKMEKCFE